MQKKSVPLRLAQRVYKHLHVRVGGEGGGGVQRQYRCSTTVLCFRNTPKHFVP